MTPRDAAPINSLAGIIKQAAGPRCICHAAPGRDLCWPISEVGHPVQPPGLVLRRGWGVFLSR